MPGSHSGGFSLISQQMAFEMEALKTARYNAAQAISSGNLELLQLAISQLVDLAKLEMIPLKANSMGTAQTRLEQFRVCMRYFNITSNYISGELGKKWALLRIKYGSQTFGVGQVGGNGAGAVLPTTPQPKKPAWMQAQDSTQGGSS